MSAHDARRRDRARLIAAHLHNIRHGCQLPDAFDVVQVVVAQLERRDRVHGVGTRASTDSGAAASGATPTAA
ncbi:MAG: hypothetical protein R2712_23100 [Vicinamibacterales bacterium]